MLISGGVRATFFATEIKTETAFRLGQDLQSHYHPTLKYFLEPNCCTLVGEQVAVQFTLRNAQR